MTHTIFHTSLDSCTQDEQLSFHSLVADEHIGLTLHPHPLNDEDLFEAGADIPTQLEFMVDNNLEELLGDSFDAKILGIHKATVSIARMHELIDADDTDDKEAPYRCQNCSKCVECKQSRRRTAISLSKSQ